MLLATSLSCPGGNGCRDVGISTLTARAILVVGGPIDAFGVEK